VSASSKWTFARWAWTVGIAGSIVGLTGAGVAGALANVHSTSADAGTQSPGSYAGHAQEAGPGLSSDVAAGMALKGLRGAGVASIEVVPAMTSAKAGLPVVRVVLDEDVDGVEARWLGSLAEGAVADEMRSTQATTSDVVSSGEVVTAGSAASGSDQSGVIPLGMGSVAAGQVFASPGDDDLEGHVADVAEDYGLTVEAVQVLHPLDTAVAVTFVVPDDASVSWTMDELRQAIEGSPHRLEGDLIRLESADGAPLVISSSAYRTGAGSLWFAPGADERFGAGHGGVSPDPSVGSVPAGPLPEGRLSQ
jgi:hypothetical protein